MGRRVLTSIKRRLTAGERLIGCVVNISSPELVEVAAAAGFDYVTIDAEHGSFDVAGCTHVIRAADAYGAPAIVRVQAIRPDSIGKALDLGATGVQVPHIRTAEDARNAVKEASFAPRGRRGLAFPRASDYGVGATAESFLAQAAEEVLVLGQVEDAVALDQLDAIAAVDGVDVVFVGPVDLSLSLGHPGALDHPEVTAAIGRIEAAATEHGRWLATATAAPARVGSALGAGYHMCAVPVVSVFQRAAVDLLTGVRDALRG
jgi:4-hydroxy-2-oxoheptanedioate aldolase